METRRLGELWPVSALTLGGGGLGQGWGKTDRAEAVATVHAAVEAGITLLDLAPLYGRGEAEAAVGAAFDGVWPSQMRVTTKCMIGSRHFDGLEERLEKSLLRSLATLKREQADIYFLHSNIHPNDYVYEQDLDYQTYGAVPWSIFVDRIVPTFEKLKARGLIGAWGITGTGLPRAIMEALRGEPKPAVTQAIANLMDSAGGMRRYEEPAEPRNIIRTAKNNDVGVMGIRAVQAGALTEAIDRPLPSDHPEANDYAKAAPFRALCKEIGEDPAVVAHRYALAMEGVDTVVLGVKNRHELGDIVAAEAKGPLEADILRRIEALGLRRQVPRIPLDAPI
ncbi:aldo/keto reductase [Parvibaculum sp.]|uniref:aldo/keto reductase n=1 Tax=Parvibaculum sp. TaxID=2024848 RepID=UPI002B5BF5D5|nr:aldo/keto reductase [Parvibaculum sp.]HUD52226.1 aldo/keto reductase [Parvibaculum sp.]